MITKKRTFWGQLWKRLSSPTPSFFKKIQVAGGLLTAFATGLTTIPGVPEKVVSVTGDLIWVGGVMALVASLAVSNPNEVKYKNQQ